MRLGNVLSNDYTAEYVQIEGFTKTKPNYKIPRKIQAGTVAINCNCKKCKDSRTLISNSELQMILIENGMFSVDARLTCPACKESVAAWFLVDCDGPIESVAPKVRVIKRSIKYTENVLPLHSIYSEYGELLEKAEIAYREGLGAGSIIYLRKIFENVTDGIADANGINIIGSNGRKINFRDRLDRVKSQVDFIPQEFSEDGYRLFGELSDVVHGEFDEEEGVRRYQTLKRLVVGVLDNVKNREEFAEARATLGWTNEEG